MYKELLQELMDAIDSGIPLDRIRNSPLAVRIDAALEQPTPPATESNQLSDTLSPEAEKENEDISYMVGDISCRLTETEVSILASALELYNDQSEDFKTLEKKIEELHEDCCVTYSLSPALEAYHDKYGSWGTENDVEEARWEGFRDAYSA